MSSVYFSTILIISYKQLIDFRAKLGLEIN